MEEIDIFNCPNMYDLRNTFEQYDNQEIFGDRGHTNSVGNKIIPEKMYEEIKNVIKDENN